MPNFVHCLPTRSLRKQRGSSSAEMVLVATFIFLPLIVVTFQSVKLGYVSMDSLISARNSAWQKEQYFYNNKDSISQINFAPLGVSALAGEAGHAFFEAKVRNVHDVTSVATSSSGPTALRIQKPLLDKARENIPAGDLTRVLDQHAFAGSEAVAYSPRVKLLGIYDKSQESPLQKVVSLADDSFLDSLANLAGFQSRVHYADFAPGWTLVDIEQYESPYDRMSAADKQVRPSARWRTGTLGMPYTAGYDAQLIDTLKPERLFMKETWPRMCEMRYEAQIDTSRHIRSACP